MVNCYITFYKKKFFKNIILKKKDSVFYIIHIFQNLKNTIKNPKISNISKIKQNKIGKNIILKKKDSVFYIIHIIQNLKNTIKIPKISNISKIKQNEIGKK